MSGRFDGINQSITFGTTVNFVGTLNTGSVWGWFRPGSITDARILNKSDGLNDADQTIMFGISTVGGGQIRCIMDGIPLSSVEAIALDTWHLIACTYDGTTIRLYFNGVEVDTALHAGVIGTDARNTRIASTGHDTTLRNFDGDIADVGLTDSFLPASIITSMNSARGAFSTFGDIRYRWLINDREPAIVIGATSVATIGPVAIAKGSGTNSPTFENQQLSFVQPVF